MFNNGLI